MYNHEKILLKSLQWIHICENIVLLLHTVGINTLQESTTLLYLVMSTQISKTK